MDSPPDRSPSSQVRRILLAVSTRHWGPHVVENAIAEAVRLRDAGAEVGLDVLYVDEAEELERAVHAVGDSGFLGPGAQKALERLLGDEHHRVAGLRVHDIEAACLAAGIRCEISTLTGDFVEAVTGRAATVRYESIHVSRDRRQVVRKLLHGDDTDRIARTAAKKGLGPVVIDED